jgi:hypothetical protein
VVGRRGLVPACPPTATAMLRHARENSENGSESKSFKYNYWTRRWEWRWGGAGKIALGMDHDHHHHASSESELAIDRQLDSVVVTNLFAEQPPYLNSFFRFQLGSNTFDGVCPRAPPLLGAPYQGLPASPTPPAGLLCGLLRSPSHLPATVGSRAARQRTRSACLRL